MSTLVLLSFITTPISVPGFINVLLTTIFQCFDWITQDIGNILNFVIDQVVDNSVDILVLNSCLIVDRESHWRHNFLPFVQYLAYPFSLNMYLHFHKTIG